VFHSSALTNGCFESFFPDFFAIVEPALRKLAIQNTQQRSGLLHSIVVMSQHKKLVPQLLSRDFVLHSVFACLQAKNVALEVLQAVMEIVENLMNHLDQEKDLLANLTDRMAIDASAAQVGEAPSSSFITALDACIRRHIGQLLVGMTYFYLL